MIKISFYYFLLPLPPDPCSPRTTSMLKPAVKLLSQNIIFPHVSMGEEVQTNGMNPFRESILKRCFTWKRAMPVEAIADGA